TPFDHQGGVDEAGDGWEAEIGPFRVRAAATRHSAPSLAWRVEADGASLVYASDTAPCDGLVRLAHGADALLAHTLLPSVEAGSDHSTIHSTVETACEVAGEARVATLLLSHRFHEEPSDKFLATAKEGYLGRIVLLERGAVVEV
ncbi:MAG TPA: MBL fold metallo-hydrolase, partial [Candidatus Thermoplasmatota archaeon]|nr:MBL fold metallo-hydrolase [Candidatus Thermoplasmatota archaeon]